jgi:tetratricopeptide (TPR) repeat protein
VALATASPQSSGPTRTIRRVCAANRGENAPAGGRDTGTSLAKERPLETRREQPGALGGEVVTANRRRRRLGGRHNHRSACRSALARAALDTCQRAATLDGQARLETLRHSSAQAEAAIAAYPDDPVAHFAAFCSRGRRLDSGALPLAALVDLRQARRSLDTALELWPEYPDALAAKGAMLLRLPRLLGGDPDLGARLLRRAAALAPDNAATQQLVTQLLPPTTVAGRNRSH